MKVRATQVGQYCNVQMDVGAVFELLENWDGSPWANPDGSGNPAPYDKLPYPVKEEWVAKLDASGKDTGEGAYVVILEDGKPVHRDFAFDQGARRVNHGKMRGDTIRIGWMEQVDESVEVTIDPTAFQYGVDPQTRKWRQPERKRRVAAAAAPEAARPQTRKAV